MAEIWNMGTNPHGAEGVYYDPSGGSRISVAAALDGKQASDADLTAIAALSGTGVAVRTASDTWALRTITGTSDRITISAGDGVSGNPTVDIAATYVGQTSIVTLGTIATGTWEGTDVGVAHGGTGASTGGGARTNLAVPGLGDANSFTNTNTFTGTVNSNTFSTSGATAGKQFNATANSLDSSHTVTTAISHYRFYNPNGQVGSIQTSGSATAYNTSSDLALKDNVTDADRSAVAATLRAGRPVSFEFRAEPGVAHLGFIAQEMFDVFSDAVSPPTEPGEPWMMDHSKLVPVLWAVVQDLLARVEALESA